MTASSKSVNTSGSEKRIDIALRPAAAMNSPVCSKTPRVSVSSCLFSGRMFGTPQSYNRWARGIGPAIVVTWAGQHRFESMLLLTLVFILSGAAGLIYESIWSRYLGLFVGHSAYAQIIVLVIFLGGMSAGAYLVGQRSERIRRPLRAYAYIELAAGAIGVLFDDVYRGVTGVAYEYIFPALAGGPGLTIAKWALAGLLILPQSILLGATFPLMSAGALRLRRDRPGGTLGLLYFANSLGAALGVLLAGFALIRGFGLPGTLFTAAAINVAVGLAVILAEQTFGWDELEAGSGRRIEGGDSADSSALRPQPAAPFHLWRLLLAVSFGTAIASFVYEIAWIRMLSLVLGSATHSFELMLSAFILGLALGAL